MARRAIGLVIIMFRAEYPWVRRLASVKRLKMCLIGLGAAGIKSRDAKTRRGYHGLLQNRASAVERKSWYATMWLVDAFLFVA